MIVKPHDRVVLVDLDMVLVDLDKILGRSAVVFAQMNHCY
jgi:septum formation inhibitor-activating ATPase MinD